MIELLSNTGYIMVNKTLIKKIGLHEALMLGELCSEYSYWKSTGKLDEEGYFFSTRENIEENIGLSSFQQRKAMTTLKELGIIEEITKGLPAKNYYRIVESKIAEIMDNEGVNTKMSNNLTTGDKEIKQQDEKKFNTNKNNITRINNNEDEEEKKEAPEEQFKENIEYEILKEDTINRNNLDNIVEIVTDILTSSKEGILINGEYKETYKIQKEMLRLRAVHIEYVLNKLRENRGKILNIKSYITTMLYNSLRTIDIDTTAEVARIMNGGEK